MNNTLAEYVSPNGEYKVVLFSRSAGATTGNSTQISLIKASKSLKNESGNLFITDETEGIEIQWLDDFHLEISGIDPTVTVYKNIEQLNGIDVVYAFKN